MLVNILKVTLVALDQNSRKVLNFFKQRGGSDFIDASQNCFFLMDEPGSVDDDNQAVFFSLRECFSKNFLACHPSTLRAILDFYEQVAKAQKISQEGRELTNKLESQFKTWHVNLSERIRLKRVIVLSSLKPITVVLGWVADVARQLSCISLDGKFLSQISVDDISQFNPDVILISDASLTLSETLSLYRSVLKAEETSAVKRGAVYFANPKYLNILALDPENLFQNLAFIVSALADLEAGYILPKNYFFKLFYLEAFRNQIEEL
jgi:hypothetical protein